MIMSAIINKETTELANITKRPRPRFTLMFFMAVPLNVHEFTQSTPQCTPSIDQWQYEQFDSICKRLDTENDCR
jgi:hypothetical protein